MYFSIKKIKERGEKKMKVKKIFSIAIAAAMAVQCAGVTGFASDNAVTPVANDIDTDWKMSFNSWERLEPAFNYYDDWSLTDGFTLNHNGAKYKEVETNAYYMTQATDKTWSIYNATKPSGDHQVWYNKDANGNPVAYAPDSENTQLWYRQGRANTLASFPVNEKENNGKPIVISFDYQSNNSETGAWVNGPATAFKIIGAGGLAFSLYNNAGNNGFAVEYGINDPTGATDSKGNPKTKTIQQKLTTSWKATDKHSVKVVLSPELSEENRYQMTAIEIDGVITKLEGITGSTNTETDVKIASIEYSSYNDDGKDYTDTINNLVIERGIAPITVSSSVEDGAEDVVPGNIALTFSDAVEMSDGAVKVYENGKEMQADSYSVTMSDNKTADVKLNLYKSYAKYDVKVDSSLVSGLLGGEMEKDFNIGFTAAVIRNIVASDKTTDWEMVFNSWERLEPAFDYYDDWSLTDGFTLNHNGAKYKEIETNAYYMTQATDKTWSIYNATKPSGDYQAWYNKDANGNPVAYDENNENKQLWYRQGRANTFARFNVDETSNNGEPIVISFDYQSNNSETSAWVNGPATAFKIMGAGGLAFSLYNNAGNNGFTVEYGINDPTGATDNKGNPKNKSMQQKLTTSWKATDKHSVKVVLSPELSEENRYQMTAIELDGVITKLEGITGSTNTETDVKIASIEYSSYNDDGKDYTDTIKNLTVQRGIDNVFATASVADGQTDVIPENITVTFTDAVELSDGAVKIYENGALMTAGYTAELGSDSKTLTVNIPDYKSRAAYRLVVDNAYVSGLMGGVLAEGLDIDFVTVRKTPALEGSENNLAEGYTLTEEKFGPSGQEFTTIETDEDGVTTITVDNEGWNKVLTNGTKGTEGTPQLYYDMDGDGTAESYGYASDSWKFAGINFNNIADVKQSTKPLVISMEYSFKNAGSNGNNMWVNFGDKNTLMYMITPFGTSPNVSGSSWDGIAYASGVTEDEWHTVQYVIDPTVDENGKTRISQITLDGEVIMDTNRQWASYGSSPAENAANGQYIKSLSMRLSLVKTAGADGALLPTVLKMKNFKILRANEFEIVADNTALSQGENELSLKFSDPVTAAALSELKVMKGTDVIENAIESAVLATDGLSAKVSMNLSETAKYALVTANLTDIYGVASSTDLIEFEYYNSADGYVSIINASKSDDGTNTTVSFTFASTKIVTPLVIAAAYDSNMNLLGVNQKPVQLSDIADVSDSIVIENVSGASSIQIMAWDSLEGMKPYCMAKNID